MARPRARRKIKAPSLKVSRKANNPYNISFAKAHPVVKANWNKKLTLRQNYEAMGLLPMLNGVAGGTGREGLERKAEQEELEKAKEEIEWRTLEDEEEAEEEGRDEMEVEEHGIEGEIPIDERALRIGSKVSLRHLPSSSKPATPQPATAPQIIALLEAEAASAVKLQRKASEQESHVLKALVTKHGLDYGKMARDMKLNRYQLTAGQLRKKDHSQGGVSVPKIAQQEDDE
ncbi:Nucleolar protein 16 [Rhizophlyctis rosea]|uniref:Nucleolar protein 16 n=1 Tax=Rhizophlyctis rosea TaxID=64517 RepID=A0AAD5X783_9FUNG|nr:Nucleolar protein 16 [Rhizophlyctis rosea]